MPKFVLNQEVPFEEGPDCEFKSIAGAPDPIKRIRDDVGEYLVAYFNGGIEGSIYWGIKDNRQAVGVPLDGEQRDKVRQAIVQKIRNIKPSIFPASYDIMFHKLFHKAIDEAPISDRPIVEVKVHSVSRQVYFTGTGQTYTKTHSGIEEIRADRLREFEKEIQVEQADQEEQEVPSLTPEVSAVKTALAPPTPFDNPYNFAVTAKEDIFKGREVEIGRLQSAIRSGTHTVIYGLQRMGKTSLVKETLRRVNENCIFAEVDFHRFRGRDMTYGGTLDAILRSIAREISPEQAREVDDGITMYINNLTGTSKHRMLDDFSILLKRTLSHTRRKVVLFLDEFSELCQAVDSNEIQRRNPNRSTPQYTKDMSVDASLIDWFSSLMKDDQLLRKLVIIFAVRPFVAQYADDTPLAILKLVRSITLGYLNEQEAKALMVEPVKGKIAYEEGSIDYLYNLTAGHPYLIQCFLQPIIDQIQQDGRNRIEKRDITDLEQEFISKEDHKGHFMVLDSDYSVGSVRSTEIAEEGRGVLAVIAHLGDGPEDDGWVPGEKVREQLSGLGMPENKIYDILAKLRGAQIIEEKAGKEKLEYRISIPLLRKRYITQNMYHRHFQQRGS